MNNKLTNLINLGKKISPIQKGFDFLLSLQTYIHSLDKIHPQQLELLRLNQKNTKNKNQTETETNFDEVYHIELILLHKNYA